MSTEYTVFPKVVSPYKYNQLQTALDNTTPDDLEPAEVCEDCHRKRCICAKLEGWEE